MQVSSIREILAELKGRLMLASAGFGALFRHWFRRHSTSASSRPARTTARWGARPRRHGRERVGADKSRSSPRGHRSGRAADEPTLDPGSGIPHSLLASAVSPSWTRLRCGSVCTAMLASSCAGHIPMLARGGGPHVGSRPASSARPRRPAESRARTGRGHNPPARLVHPSKGAATPDRSRRNIQGPSHPGAGHENGSVFTSLRAVASSVGPAPNDGHHRATPHAPHAGLRA